MPQFDYAQLPQQTYQSIASTATSYLAMQAQLGKELDFPDADNIVGQNPVTYNANYRRRCVLVQNNPSGSVITPGAPLQFTAGATTWGIQVDAAAVGAVARLVAPGYVNGSSANTIPVGAFFWAVKSGPTSVLSDGTIVAAGDLLAVGTAAGSAKTNYGLGGGEIFSAIVAATPVAATNVATKFDQSYTLPAKSLQAGDTIRVVASVIAPTTVGADTLTLELLIGATVVAATTAIDVANNDTFEFMSDIVVRTAGASGTIFGTTLYNSSSLSTGFKVFQLASTTIDTTATQQVAVRATWSTTNANSCTLNVLNISKINVAGAGPSVGTAIAGAAAGSAVLFRAQVNCVW